MILDSCSKSATSTFKNGIGRSRNEKLQRRLETINSKPVDTDKPIAKGRTLLFSLETKTKQKVSRLHPCVV